MTCGHVREIAPPLALYLAAAQHNMYYRTLGSGDNAAGFWG